MLTFDKATIDSTGAFLIGQLEKFDPKVNEPLVSITYSRDVTLRTDVSIADESASFTQDSFASKQGSTGGYVGTNTTTVGEVGLDVKKIVQPLNLWSKKAAWTIAELTRSMQLGRPIDLSKIAVLSKDFQMTADRTMYIGSSEFGTTGLFNNADVSLANATTGSWATATADQILADVNELLTRAYKNSAFAVAPSELRVDPDSFGVLTSKKVSDAGNISVLEYVKINCLSNSINGRPLNIQPAKFAASGQAVSNKNRMVAYSNDSQYVQFPMVPLQRQQMVYQDIAQSVAYLGSLGQVEIRYPETVAYSDGL